MANLSSIDQFSGVVQGVTGGIQNAGAIQQLIHNRDRIAREDAEAPLRTEALRQGISATGMQNEAAGIDRAQKKQKVEDLKRPWNPAIDPIFQQMDGPQKAEHLQMIKDFTGGVPPTIAHRQAFAQYMGETLKGLEYGTKVGLALATKAVGEAKKNLDNDAIDPTVPAEVRAQHFADFNAATAKVDSVKGEIGPMKNEVAVLEVMKKYPDLMQNKHLAAMAVLSAKTGKTDGLVKILEIAETNKAKGLPNTAFELFLSGKMAQASKEGSELKAEAWAKEWETISKKSATGDHVQTIHGSDADGNPTVSSVILKDGKVQTVLGTSDKYKKPGEKLAPIELRLKAMQKDKRFALMPLPEFQQMESRLANLEPAFDTDRPATKDEPARKAKHPYNPAWAASGVSATGATRPAVPPANRKPLSSFGG